MNMRIHFYGCSFTKGGGLHSKEYHSHYEKVWYPKDWSERGKEFFLYGKEPYTGYGDHFNFPSHIGRVLGVEIINHSITANNNDYIFQVCYDSMVKYPNDIHILQWTILSRRNFFYESTKETLRVQGTMDLIHIFNQDKEDILYDPIYENLSSFYRDYLMYVYDYTYEKQNIHRLSNLLHSFNPNLYLFSYEDIGDVSYMDRFILFDNLHLRDYIDREKLTISDYTSFNHRDSHLSIYGHSIIGNYIINYISQSSPAIRLL